MVDKTSSPHLFADVLARVHAACGALAAQGVLPAGIDLARVVVEPTREASHGDMATNAAMVLAKEAKAKPRDLAEAIRSSWRSFSAIFSASSRGFARASLASTIAALVAMSPCAASRGGSTTTRDRSAFGHPPSAASAVQTACTRANTSANRCCDEVDFAMA